jgi:PAS domain S-box-containing protein
MTNIHLSDKAIMNGRGSVLTLVDSMPALVAYVDCNMVLHYCNQPFRTWFSLDGNPNGRILPMVVGKEMFGQLQQHMGKVLVGEKTHFQVSVDTDKGVQYLEVTLSPDFDDEREVVGFIFHSSDVTEKNRTERALKDYFEQASIGMHWVDADGIIIWANPAEIRMLGYSEEEYVGHHISEFHANKKAIASILTRLRSREAIENCEVVLLCKDGSIRYATLNSTALWDGNKFVHTRCFTVDITEQKLAVRSAKESEERFRMMANLVPLVIWTTDQEGTYNYLSDKWKELTGADVASGIGNSWMRFVHGDDRENVLLSWHQSLSERRPFEAKFRLRHDDGVYRVSYVNGKPRFNSSGEFLGYIGILQDISSEEQIRSSLERMVLERTEDLRKKNADLRRAEKTLQEQNAKLEEINNQLNSFAHVASHDLQEPLRKIQTFTTRLFELEGNKFSDRGKELSQRIYRSSDRMKSLIQDLLAYSRTNVSDDKFERVDLNLLLNEVLGELEVKISEKSGTIENRGLPEMKVIPFQFQQLFLNLLSNALKFAKENEPPHVTISSELTDDPDVPLKMDAVCRQYHHIAVRDNGIGFDPEAADQIFEIFQRLHTRSQYEGTGIGLAICKKIVENHRGVIAAEGKVNEGATFHIYIPAC